MHDLQTRVQRQAALHICPVCEHDLPPLEGVSITQGRFLRVDDQIYLLGPVMYTVIDLLLKRRGGITVEVLYDAVYRGVRDPPTSVALFACITKLRNYLGPRYEITDARATGTYILREVNHA